MNQNDVFLQAILASPDGDTPRLVYADFLEEHGEPERAEFIRIQCELGDGFRPRAIAHYHMPPADSRRAELEARERVLRAEHEDQWVQGLLEPLAGMVTGWDFRRGFMEYLSVEARGLVQDADRLFSSTPLTAMHIYVANRRIDQVMALPQLARLRDLNLNGNRLDDSRIRVVASSPNLRGLSELLLTENQIECAGAQVLADCSLLPNLQVLALAYNSIGEAGGLALSASKHLRNLTHLDLSNNPLGSEARAALRARFGDRVQL